jgi:hypothetical protein
MMMNGCNSISKSRTGAFLIGLSCLMLVVSCAVPFRDDGRDNTTGRDAGGVSRTDPLHDPGDDAIATATDIGLPDYAQTASDTVGAMARPGESAAVAGRGAGFDVQFFASQNVLQARQVKQQVDTLTDMPVRIVFAEPYYKVLAGPYPSFEEAEAFLRLVTRLEYTSAWIVAHEVNRGK